MAGSIQFGVNAVPKHKAGQEGTALMTSKRWTNVKDYRGLKRSAEDRKRWNYTVFTSRHEKKFVSD